MDPPYSRFRDEVVRHLENEVIPGLSEESELYLECKVRPRGDQSVQIRDLRFLRRNVDGDLELVNTELAGDCLLVEFHFDNVEDWSEWSDLLVKFTVSTDCHHLETPYALKWERTGSLGRLKADERFDEQREYIRKRIGPKRALLPALNVMLHEYLPGDLHQLSRTTDIPLLIQRLFEEEPNAIDELKPTEL